MSRTSQVLLAVLAVTAMFTIVPMVFGQEVPAEKRVVRGERPPIKVFAIRHSKSQEVERVLRSFFGKRGRVTIASDVKSNSILASGSRSELARIESMITTLDCEAPKSKQPQDIRVDVIKLANRQADHLQPIIFEMFQSRGTPGRAPLRVIADHQLNALVIRADEKTMLQIKALIIQLDVKIPARKDKK